MTFLNGLFAEVEDVGLASGFGVVAAGAAGDFEAGGRPARGLLSFACPKESNQRKRHPNDTLSPVLLALSRRRPKGLPVPRSPRAIPRAPFRAFPAQDCDARACHTGPYRHSDNAPNPVCRAEHRSFRPEWPSRGAEWIPRVARGAGKPLLATPAESEERKEQAATGRLFLWLLSFGRAKESSSAVGPRTHSKRSYRKAIPSLIDLCGYLCPLGKGEVKMDWPSSAGFRVHL